MRNPLIHILCNYLYYLSGLLSFIYISVNLTFWIVPVVVLALIKFIAPGIRMKARAYQMMIRIYQLVVRTNDFLLFKMIGNKVEIRNPVSLGNRPELPGPFQPPVLGGHPYFAKPVEC